MFLITKRTIRRHIKKKELTNCYMSFIQRPERRKKITRDDRVTLESKHLEIINNFKNRRESIPLLNKRLYSLKLKYEKQNEKDFRLFNEIQNLETQIKQNNIEIVDAEESEYFVNTHNILDEYRSRHDDKNHIHSISQLHNKYMSIVDPKNNIYTSDDENVEIICKTCGSLEIIKDGVCIDCGTCVGNSSSVISDTPEFKDSDRITVKVPFHYKKSSYFEKIKNQFQAKIIPNIQKEDIEIIGREIKRNRINKENVNYDIFKELLKRLSKTNGNKRFTGYYKFIPYFLDYYFGIPAPKMSSNLEFKLNSYFLQVEKAFITCIKGKEEFDNRSSIPNSEFTMYKLLELLGGDEGVYDDLLPYFRLLKDVNKLKFLDKMWKKICEYNKWFFIPTRV